MRIQVRSSGTLLGSCALLLVVETSQAAAAKPDRICIDSSGVQRSYYPTCEADGGAVYERRKAVAKKSGGTGLPVKAPTVPTSPAGPVPALLAPVTAATKACVDGWNTHLVIGDSFNDINFLDTANCNAVAAKGAQFSWTRDAVLPNTQWSAKGAIAEKIIWIGGPDGPPAGPYLNLFAIAPEVTFQKVTNSNVKQASQNLDVLSYGFSSEALFDRVADVWQVYLRARVNVNGDFEGNTKSWSGTTEIQPLSDAFRIGSNIPVGDIGYFWVLPLIRAQYFQRVNGSTDPIFNQGNDVFRAGPVVSFNFVPQDTTNVDPTKPPPAPKWVFNLTYSWYQNFLGTQTFYNINPSLTFNFTENVAFSLGYQRGQIDQTAKAVDLATVSLTVKN